MEGEYTSTIKVNIDKKEKNSTSSSDDNAAKYEAGKIFSGSQETGDENQARGNWSNQLDFLLSCLGYAVGLGNVWRFPYLCYRNGGGAFLIPYTIMLIFIGIPLFYMELSLGQFTSSGPLTCWNFAPIMKGLGMAQMVISMMVSIYFNMIIAWAIYYFVASFNLSLPWSGCSNYWNTEACSERQSMKTMSCDQATGAQPPVPGLTPNTTATATTTTLATATTTALVKYDNGTCFSLDGEQLGIWDYEVFHNSTGVSKMSPSSEYYYRRVLNISEGIENMGDVQWELVAVLFAAWVITFMCMMKGIKSTGKVVYFTAIFPVVILIILGIRGITLKNSWNGVYFYIVPDFSKLTHAKVWNDAAIQIFFSLSDCWGGLIALSSYNRFHNNVFRDTIIVCVGNCITSVFAGVVIFSFIGFMAGEMNVPLADVVDKGPGLAFIVYPDAVTKMPIAPLWSVLFFMMLITLGLDSQFTMLETVITSLMDQFKELRSHKMTVTLVMCIGLFFCGLPMCTEGGVFLLQLMDSYAGGWGLLTIGLCECFGIGWLYGSDRFLNDISVMTNAKPYFWWKLCWQYISPLLITALLIFVYVDYSPASYGDYQFPKWADNMGWCITLSSVMWIPIYSVWLFAKVTITNKPYSSLYKPTKDWGPALAIHRKLVKHVEGFQVYPEEANGIRQPEIPGDNTDNQNSK